MRLGGFLGTFADRDLNRRARLALLGLSNTPEDDIADLLSSDVPIDRVVRMQLARAFRAKGAGLKFKARNAAFNLRLKQIVQQLERLRAGREAAMRVGVVGYEQAIKDLAKRLGLGISSAKGYVTFAKQVDDWLDQVRTQHSVAKDLDDYSLEIAFIYGSLTDSNPEEALRKKSLGTLFAMVKEYDDLRCDVDGTKRLTRMVKRWSSLK